MQYRLAASIYEYKVGSISQQSINQNKIKRTSVVFGLERIDRLQAAADAEQPLAAHACVHDQQTKSTSPRPLTEGTQEGYHLDKGDRRGSCAVAWQPGDGRAKDRYNRLCISHGCMNACTPALPPVARRCAAGERALNRNIENVEKHFFFRLLLLRCVRISHLALTDTHMHALVFLAAVVCSAWASPAPIPRPTPCTALCRFFYALLA